MKENEIRLEILKIQSKYYTPTSKISDASGVDRALLSKFLNESLDRPMYPNMLQKLQEWLEDRKIDE